jgi:hypothetical protein
MPYTKIEPECLARPTVHLNGTSREELLKGYSEAYTALRKAMDALSQCSPNGRDYYVQGDKALRVALDQHSARQQAVRDVADEILAIGEELV